MKVAVIGAGSWGAAMTRLLGLRGCEAMLWARAPEVSSYVNERGCNPPLSR